LFGRLGEQGRDFPPLRFGQQRTNGPDRAIAPPSALLTLLISHFHKFNYSHFNGLSRVVQQLLVIIPVINISNEVGRVKRDLIFVSKLDRNVPFFAFWFAFFFLSSRPPSIRAMQVDTA
jgi:hypothetical protein